MPSSSKEGVFLPFPRGANSRERTALERSIHIDWAVLCYAHGLISAGQAAELAGISPRDFLEVLHERRIPTVRWSHTDEEYEELRDWARNRR